MKVILNQTRRIDVKTVGNASLLKDINTSVILNAIKDHEPISRAELVNLTKLALPTVLRIVKHLICEGKVIEIGKGDTSFGRKPIMLKINHMGGYLIGVKISRRLVIILTDFNGKILDQIIELTDIGKGPGGVVRQIKSIVYKLIADFAIPIEKIAGIGIATPGSRFKTGSLIASSVFAGWENADFDELLKENLPDFKTVSHNVTICGAIGEQWFGLGKNIRNYIYVYVDYGVGGGVIIDGKVYLGRDGYAGHIGHSVVNFEGEPCYCGNKGCLEMYTSTAAIVRKIQTALKEGARSILREQVNGDFGNINFNMVMEAYKYNDDLVVETIAKAGKIMGIGIANSINMFNPDLVIMGGEVCYSCPVFTEEAIKAAKENTFALKAKDIEIAVSNIEQPEVLGAAALVMNEIYKKPEV
jgi:N-acetylglucosamine repressor